MSGEDSVLTVADVRFHTLGKLLSRYGLSLHLVDDEAGITGSYCHRPY